MTFRQFQDHVISRFLIFRSVKYLSFYSFEDLFRSDRIRPRPWYWLTDLDPKNTQTPVQYKLYCSNDPSNPGRPLDPGLSRPYISLNSVLVKFLIDHESWSNWAIFTWKWPYIEFLIIFDRFVSLIFTFAELIVDESPLTWISKNWFE